MLRAASRLFDRRFRLTLGVLVAAILLAQPATATDLEGVAAAKQTRGVPQEWVGRFCPIGGCTGGPGSGLSNAAGFAGAVVLAGWWVQRRSRTKD